MYMYAMQFGLIMWDNWIERFQKEQGVCKRLHVLLSPALVIGLHTRLTVSLVPSPTPSFSSLAVRTASDEKLGDGLGTRLANSIV